jgi:hypothetical protein
MRYLGLLSLLFTACVAPFPVGEEAAAPFAAGKADSLDAADHDCRVILRSVEVLDGASLIDIDVAAGEGALLSREGTRWLRYDGLAIQGAPGGFHRYRVRLETTRGTIAPYAKLPSGGRLFDHNRHAGDFESYALDGAFADDGVCAGRAQPRATIDFKGDYRIVQRGALVRGGHVTINYDLSRLTSCRGTHNGFRFWSMEASIRFLPSGLVSTGTVVAGQGEAFPFEADIPDGTQSAELWFHNQVPGSCDAWDSNYGRNYQFPVGAQPPAIGWAGDWGSSFSRSCEHQSGVPEPAVIDEYVRERACSFIDADVWVPGGETHPEWIQAQVEYRKDANPAVTAWLEPVGRVGNNQRVRWTVPYEIRNTRNWSTVKYRFRFSTDGNQWTYLGQPDGSPRTIQFAE